MILVLAVAWLTLVAGVSYKANHAWPSRRSIRDRLIRNNNALRIALSERTAQVLLSRANARVLVARRAARRRLVAGLLSLIGAATLINAPLPDDRRSRHSTGLETAQTV